MPYVKRDENGRIIALLEQPEATGCEPLSAASGELLEFLADSGDESALTFLRATDQDLIRVLEDLVNLLIEKRIIRFTDLPDDAQQKLLGRRRARERLSGSESPVIDTDDII